MMRLFFHLVDATGVIPDLEGVEADGPIQMRDAIVADVRELLREFSPEERQGWQLRVTDETGVILLAIPLGPFRH